MPAPPTPPTPPSDDNDKPLGPKPSGKFKNLKAPPIRRSRIPLDKARPNAPSVLDKLEPGQTDLTAAQAREIAAKMGVRLPKDFEKLLIGGANGNNGASRTAAEAIAGVTAENIGLEAALNSRGIQSPSLIKSKAERNKAKLGMLLPYTSAGFATFYDSMYHTRGFRLERHLLHIVHGLLDDRIKKLLVTIGPGSGKALHPDTKVLTARGWIRMGEIGVGDYVLTPDGKTWARVRGVFEQPWSKLYKLTFADGRVIRANAEHIWKVYNKKFLLGNVSLKWRLRTTEEIYRYRHAGKKEQLKWYVPLTDAVAFPEKALPIDPYVMGALLGDGNFSETGFCRMTSADPEIMERIAARYEVTQHKSKYGYGVLGCGPAIRAMGLAEVRSWDKAIPEIYFQGSIEQRWELLRGLMDTDGYVDVQHTTNFCTTSETLANQVTRLVHSLGGIASISLKKTVFSHKGEKRQGRIAYQINIRHPQPEKLFHLTRKKLRAQPTQYSDDLKLEIVSIEQESLVSPSICINIEHPDGLFLIENFVVTHNSALLSTVFPAFRLGTDPTHTILGISAGEALMQGFQAAVMDWIEFSPQWRAFFPNVRPDKNKGWSTERGMFVKGHPDGDPDASYLACGLTSKRLTGVHARLILGDDLHDEENSTSAESCEGVITTFYRQIMGRADPRGARFVFAGRRWHENDLYNHLMLTGEWVVMNLPALRDRGPSDRLYWDITIPDGLECCFTEIMRGDAPSNLGDDILKLPTE